MLFKTDEKLPVEAAESFRSAGYDCLTVEAQELGGASDLELAEVCRAEDRVLVTLDAGFGNISTYSPARYPGIVVLRLSLQSKPRILAVIERVIDALSETPLENDLWIVDERRIRVRS